MRPSKEIIQEMSKDLLEILKEMRLEEGIPFELIRHRQLALWALRQLRYHPEYMRKVPLSSSSSMDAMHMFPGWTNNYRKFVQIHQPAQGRA